jgi:Flp pilus assembly protein protease CpaA
MHSDEYRLLFKFVATILVAVVTWLDLRDKQVSNWLMLPPLLGAATLWPALRGEWIVPIFLLVLLLVIDSAPKPARLPLLLGTVALIANLTSSSQASLLVVAWALFYGLWDSNVIAGADAKAAMALIGFWPETEMLMLIAVSHVVAGLYFLILRHGRNAPRRLYETFTRALTGQLPTRDELESGGDPMMVAFGLAGLVYVWGFWR